MLIGLISDTHGLWRPEIATAFEGVELIFHAGDVGSHDVLSELERLAPVEAVQGNIDSADLGLPHTIVREIAGVEILITHGNDLNGPTPEKLVARYHAGVIVFGHTHRALVRKLGTTLVINPGAAGPRRFDAKPSVALLAIESGTPEAQIVKLAG